MKKYRQIIGALCAFCILSLAMPQANAYIKSGDVFYQHKNSSKKIALTFDDGPHPTQTAEILDLLKEYDVKATFFVVGENVEQNPEIVLRELQEGHEVGNHTYTHPNLKTLNIPALSDEILKTEQLLYELCEYRPKLFRPPCGFCEKDLVTSVSGMDYFIILWTIDTLDWNHNSIDAITSTILKNVSDGAIILCHDYIAKNSPTKEALKRIIPALQKEGYQFVTISELLMSN